MVRILTSYTKSRAKDGLTTGVVWLSDDATEAENTIKRVKHALTEGVPIGVSPDGREGPGSYGLNRKVTLTILVGNKDKVTANFALVQPSLQADLPKILDAIVKEVGGKAPKLEEIEGHAEGEGPAARKERRDREPARPARVRSSSWTRRPRTSRRPPRRWKSTSPRTRRRRPTSGGSPTRSSTPASSTDYGTPKAQEYLKKWAKEYGTPKKEEPTKPRKKP